jgi:lipopolysaccharide cholinephosphotransferase
MTQNNERRLNLDDLKAHELGILEAFDEYCDKHSLTYWIAYGTLLGAVRHKGFIPWDDDIDIIMPVADYRRLIALTNEGEHVGAQYRFAAHSVKESRPYHATFGKIYDRSSQLTEFQLREKLGFREGVYIDVFPLVGIPEDPRERKQLLQRIKHLDSLVNLCTFKFCLSSTLLSNVLRFASIIPARVAGYRYWLDCFDRIVDALPSHEATTHGICPPYTKVIYPSKAFQSSIRLEFSGKQFPAPGGWETLLRLEYGDYLQLPAPELRVSVHQFEAFKKS